MKARAVILAAGTSSRMGAQKLLIPVRGRMMIEHAIEAAQAWHPLVVAGREVAQALGSRSDIDLIVNEEPERGMTHSLQLADAELPRDEALIVLLGDKPLVSEALTRRICDALGSADICYPFHETSGEPGHPVVFSSRAREKIQGLAEGDTLRALRDDASLQRVTVPVNEPGAFYDVDTPDTLERS
jgi:molybdenum cofactor cytidylyltransferase